MEWMIIIVTLASPQDPRMGGQYPVVQMERFASEAECKRAGAAVSSFSRDVGGPNGSALLRWSCGPVEPLETYR